ncbi:MI domain-containing protein [Mycena indigotica]|uniref:MI domain-containing protein n=1 Tax=Mycena indigotica TaxID=2126181 RepID=A0A8H6TD12_9AGAR|nr:MI domain-containing protein [Mycena indigotica]KAF7315064.1 MI domain-containing protein [Mycena indigotica]
MHITRFLALTSLKTLANFAAPDPPILAIVQSKSSYVWTPNVPAGTVVRLQANDSSGTLASTNTFVIQKGTDTSCVILPSSQSTISSTSSLGGAALSLALRPSSSQLSSSSASESSASTKTTGKATAARNDGLAIAAIVVPVCTLLVFLLIGLLVLLRRRRRQLRRGDNLNHFTDLENSENPFESPISSPSVAPGGGSMSEKEMYTLIREMQNTTVTGGNERIAELQRQIEDLMADNAMLSGELPPDYENHISTFFYLFDHSMSKSSTATGKNSISSKSAWAKGPPQTASAPSPRSQSPAPSPTSNGPQPTHSRRSSTLGQGVPIKDGVSIPGKNVGAVKQGSAVTFGSIDDASAPISSSPAPPTAPIKSEVVKSFGTVPAAHVNGKPSISKSIGVSSSSSPTTSTPVSAVPSTSSSPAPKLNKMDVRALFQNPSTPAPPSSQPETSSPSIRTASLPQPSQPPQPPNPSQFGTPFSTFVPRQQQQQPQNGGASGSRPPPSPVYGRPPIPNGNGPRPPNGPQVPNSAMGSPRLSQNPQPGMQTGMPPQMAPPMGWSGYYYGPPTGLPSDQPGYMYQPSGWYMPAPQMPPQGQPMHPAPQMPPQPGMPMSPRTHPIPLHSGPGTPTPAHAVPVPPHHAAPPLAQHSSSGSVTAVSSPPPTPSTARLNTGAPTFVPGGAAPRPKSKIVLKSADGTEVKLESLKQHVQPAATPATPPTSTVPLATNSPGHQSRKSVQIRMESEEARKKRIAADEEAKEKAEKAEKDKVAKAKAEAEEKEKERLRKEKAEADRKKKEEEDKKRRLEEEERKRKEEEEAKVKAEKEEKERKEKEELERKAEEERQKKLEEEAAAEAKLKESATITEEPVELEDGELQEVEPISDKDKDSGEATPIKDTPLRIDTAPSTEGARRRPGRLDLSSTLKTNIPSALPSALATARIIEDLSRITYPENIQSPKLELNANAKDGKFRYDRDFLLQFMLICKEKPDNLPPLDAIGIGPADQAAMTRTSSRGGTHRPGRTSSMSGPSGGNTTPGFPFPGKGPAPFGGSMGHFQGAGTKLTSEERFALANGNRATSVSGLGQFRPAQMQRTASQPGVGSALGSKRTRSKRGETRDKHNSTQALTPLAGIENAAPLAISANRWDRRALNQIDADSPEAVDRKVKSLLNKLTMEKFDSLSDQIIQWANKSEKEKDGRTLIQVIRLVFEKATDEATWSEMYARLCRKMMEQISPKVQDDGIKNAEGKPIAGGQLFRKYLLNRCQEDFERGWVAKEATAAAAALKATEDKAKAAAQEKKDEEGGNGDSNEDPVLYSDEYYAAQKAKRQGLGLIKFIGELFKLQMLTERIMHECVKKLLGNVENPEEEEIESLCKLISTVGSLLDTQKARAHMDVYFSRMKELAKSKSVSSRMQFMLQDVIELRDRKWAARSTQMAAPTTIQGVHDAAARDAAKAEKDSYQRTISMSRGGSRRGAERGDFQGPGPDGWTNVQSSGSGPRPPPKAGDLSQFGKMGSSSKAGLPMTLGPSSVFSGRKDSKRESLSRTSSNSNMSSSNMFSMLSQTESSPESKAPEPTQRKRLILAPRSKPTEESAATPAGSDESESESEGEAAVAEMSDEAADRKVAEDSKEFFAIRNLDEAEAYFSALPPAHHPRLVEKLAGSALEAKESDAQLVADLFGRASSKELCSAEAFEEGLAPLAEILEDIAIDAPKAPNYFALIMKLVTFDDERQKRVAEKTGDADKLLALIAAS